MTENQMKQLREEGALYLSERRQKYIQEFIAGGGSDTDIIGFAEFLAEKQSKERRRRQSSPLPGA